MLDEPMVTIAEAAKLLRVHTATIRRYISSGRLPAYRIGRRRLAVRRRDLDRLIEPRDTGDLPQPQGRGPYDDLPAQNGDDGSLAGDDGWLPIRTRLTPEEQRRGLAVMAELQALQAEMLSGWPGMV
jgi:excisionase family DNA binding protein